MKSRIVIEVDYRIGDLVFDQAGNRLSIHSIRADFILDNHCDIYYHCRNIDVNSQEYNAYAWFRKESLTPIDPKNFSSSELPF